MNNNSIDQESKAGYKENIPISKLVGSTFSTYTSYTIVAFRSSVGSRVNFVNNTISTWAGLQPLFTPPDQIW